MKQDEVTRCEQNVETQQVKVQLLWETSLCVFVTNHHTSTLGDILPPWQEVEPRRSHTKAQPPTGLNDK